MNCPTGAPQGTFLPYNTLVHTKEHFMDDLMLELRTVVFVLLLAFLSPICLLSGVNVATSLVHSPTVKSCEKVK